MISDFVIRVVENAWVELSGDSRKARIEEIVAILSTAFAGYIQYDYIFGLNTSTEYRIERLRGLFRGYVEDCLENGKLICLYGATSGRIEAVLLCYRRNKYSFRLPLMDKMKAILQLGLQPFRRLEETEGIIARNLNDLCGGRDHLYAFLLAVDPNAQGGGRGKMLMKKLFELADKENLEVRLDTAEPSLQAYYQSLGFQMSRSVPAPTIYDSKSTGPAVDGTDGVRCSTPVNWNMLFFCRPSAVARASAILASAATTAASAPVTGKFSVVSDGAGRRLGAQEMASLGRVAAHVPIAHRMIAASN